MSRRKKRDRAWAKKREQTRRFSAAVHDEIQRMMLANRRFFSAGWPDDAIDVEHRQVETPTAPNGLVPASSLDFHERYSIPHAAASLRENYSEPPEWRREYMGKFVEPPPELPRSGDSFTLRPRGPKFRAGMNVTIIDEQGAMEATVVADVGGKPG